MDIEMDHQVEMFWQGQYTAEFAFRKCAYPLLYPFSCSHLLLLQTWPLPITGISILRFSVTKVDNKKIITVALITLLLTLKRGILKC